MASACLSDSEIRSQIRADRKGDFCHGGCQEFSFVGREWKTENKLTNVLSLCKDICTGDTLVIMVVVQHISTYILHNF